jgi:hypothetical protein
MIRAHLDRIPLLPNRTVPALVDGTVPVLADSDSSLRFVLHDSSLRYEDESDDKEVMTT